MDDNSDNGDSDDGSWPAATLEFAAKSPSVVASGPAHSLRRTALAAAWPVLQTRKSKAKQSRDVKLVDDASKLGEVLETGVLGKGCFFCSLLHSSLSGQPAPKWLGLPIIIIISISISISIISIIIIIIIIIIISTAKPFGPGMRLFCDQGRTDVDRKRRVHLFPTGTTSLRGGGDGDECVMCAGLISKLCSLRANCHQ